MMTNRSKHYGSIPTTWELYTYDVWGNAKDGYEVNSVYCQGEIEMRIPQTKHNVGTPQEFVSAYPTHRAIKRALGIRCRIETDGDETSITIDRSRDGFPLAELRCISHDSLSPVRKAQTTK